MGAPPRARGRSPVSAGADRGSRRRRGHRAAGAGGVGVVRDGESPRSTFIGPLVDVVDGIQRAAGGIGTWRDDQGASAQPGVAGRLHPRRSVAIEELSYARAGASKPVKMTLPSPLMLAMVWSPDHSLAAYDDPFECFAHGAEIIRN